MTAISDYFRTALLIDDRIDADYRPLEPLRDEQAEGRPEEPKRGLVAPPADDETPVQPSDLVHAFLAENVVCSVLEPSEDTSKLTQQALQGARIADLLILDWVLFGDDSAAVDAIRAIAERHERRLTVIVVFTGAQSLSVVVDRLIEDASFEEADDFVLTRGSTVALVFGKPGIPLTGGEDVRQPANYRELPGMIRDDLEMIFKGLMPDFAFRGINALRKSAPRILTTFSSDLDIGALVQRALLPEPSDAASQFVHLLANEFEQALRDERAGDAWNIDSSSESLAQMMNAGNPSGLADRLRSSETTSAELRKLDDGELARRAVTDGLSKIGLKDSVVRRAVGDLTAVFGESRTSNESLAVLMSSTALAETPPRLELGVVLRSENQRGESNAEMSYWLCIQPLCDSVRLREARAFPLSPIAVNVETPDAMIRPPEGNPIRVAFDSSPHKLVMAQFAPTDQGAVIARGDSSNWYFTTVDDVRYRAVSRLRPDVAAQVVHRFATAASRAGVDASEWLRRGGSS